MSNRYTRHFTDRYRISSRNLDLSEHREVFPERLYTITIENIPVGKVLTKQECDIILNWFESILIEMDLDNSFSSKRDMF